MKHVSRAFALSSLVSVYVICFSGNTYAAEPAVRITPGQWEVTLQTTEPLLGPPTTELICVTPESISRVRPPTSKPNDACQSSNGSLANSVLTYTMTCAKLARKTTTTFTFKGDTYTGSMVMETPNGTMKQTIEAHRVGECNQD